MAKAAGASADTVSRGARELEAGIEPDGRLRRKGAGRPAVEEADPGLVPTLESSGPFTVFAPTNEAFAKLPAGTVDTLLKPENKAKLTSVLTYHVVAGRYTPTQLAAGTPLKTLEGGTVTPALMGSTYEVNSADVVCGNVQTANATVYIINTVLMPPSS